MTHVHPAPDEATGIVHARTREGFDLPVIDVTNPRFAVPDDPAAVARINDAFLAETDGGAASRRSLFA